MRTPPADASCLTTLRPTTQISSHSCERVHSASTLSSGLINLTSSSPTFSAMLKFSHPCLSAPDQVAGGRSATWDLRQCSTRSFVLLCFEWTSSTVSTTLMLSVLGAFASAWPGDFASAVLRKITKHVQWETIVHAVPALVLDVRCDGRSCPRLALNDRMSCRQVKRL